MTDVPTRKGDHLAEEDCVDFARGQDESARRKLLEEHLESGCRPCLQKLRLWRSVTRIAADEASFRPPAEALRQTKGHFVLRGSERRSPRAFHAAALVFDSLRQPLLAVRAAGATPERQLLYRAGHYVIRLQLETKGDPERVSIVGQLLDERQPDKSLRDIAVLVSKAGRALDRTLTNYLGEFTLEPNAAGTLRLSVGVPEIGTFTVHPPRGTAKEVDERASGS